MSDINVTIGDTGTIDLTLSDAGDINLALSGISTFQALSDTPSSYSGQASKFVKVNSGEDGVEFITSASSSPLTTKGDLFTYDTSDARLPVGTNNQVLIADSAQSLGVKWGTAGAAPVDSVFNRTGVVVATTNDYTWAQINKATSDIADITTKSHTSLSDIGTNTHTQIDTHIANVTTNPHSVDATDLSLENVSNVATSDTAYNATSWNTNTDSATKNAIRDKVETMDTAIGLNTAKVTNATHTGDVTGSGALSIDKTAITGQTLVTAAAGDQILITDSTDTNNLKKVNVSDFLGGGGDMLAATYDAATITEQLVGLTATQTLTNKTLTTPTITLNQGATPAPTAEGDIQWDTDGNQLVIGDGTGSKTFSDDTVVEARANHTGTQTASTISDFDSSVSGNSDVTANTTHRGLTTGNPHSVTLTDVGGTTDHTALSNIGTNTHAQIDTHIANVTTNPHSVDKSDVGLGNVANVDTTNASNISSGTLSSSLLPPVALTSVQVAASEVAQLALTTEEGDVVVRSDENKSYMKNDGTADTMADFTELQTPTDSVLSVNSETGTVILTTGDISEDANANYVSDAQLTVIGNTSGTNSGDDPANDTAYNATSWNTNTDSATKNAIRDQVEIMITAEDLNTTHRGSSGSDHSDVVTNTTHRGLTNDPHNVTAAQVGLGNVNNVGTDDTAYNATSWNTNTDAATKNAIRDKVETMDTAIGLNTAKDTNVSTNLSEGTNTTTTVDVNSSDGTNATLVSASTTRAGLLTKAKWDEIVANTSKSTNVSTNLSAGPRTATTIDVDSSDGTDATLVEADTTNAGILGSDKWDEIVANSLKVSNANHSGDATGSTTLTLATVNSNVGSFTAADITVNAKGLITAAADGSGGGGITWNEVTGTSQSASVDNGYITNNAGLVTVTLPDTAVLGSVLRIAGNGAGGWKLAQNASEIIHFGNSTTTTGTGGSLASTLSKDAIELVCIVANTEWSVISSVGNITVV